MTDTSEENCSSLSVLICVDLWLPLRCNLHEGSNDARPREKCAAQCATNLRWPAGSATMIHRHLENAQTRACGLHLHLQIPPVGLLTHAEPLEQVAPDRSKWTHIRVTNTVQYRQQPAGQSSGEQLLEIHASGLAFSARARANHEIILSLRDRIHKLTHQLWAIASVAIEEHDNVAFRRKRAYPRCAGAAVTMWRCCNHGCACLACALSSLIGASIVHNDDVVRQGGRETFANHLRDRLLFIERRDNHRYVHGAVELHRKISQAIVK